MAEKPVVDVVGLGKTVDNGDEPLTILQDISFSVMPGETMAIVGASGSGKSTLLGLLAGLDVPTSGEIRLDGVSLAALDEDARARQRGKLLGFVFQSFQLLPSLNALENVMLPLELAGSKASTATAHWLVGTKVGLEHRLKHYPKHLSGGEQQRVALARAFAPESPRLVLADEPTGNLDAATGQQIIELMFELNRNAGHDADPRHSRRGYCRPLRANSADTVGTSGLTVTVSCFSSA
jgi:putative ABC transport system ATP-binding protein